ncbi:LexA family transcriptional regulator [Bacteroides neonati]|uniref:LexA family transcriptional regulator n=1 Tax=Bacteroides neonati TaxID=1347393 RepID=UPI0004B238FC|nr:hypothetical protein [Bacteroides neonati]
MQTEGERISSIISHFCKSKAEFARTMEESPQAVSNWVSRGAGKNVLNKILSKFPNVNTNWLLTGEGEMLQNSEESNPSTQTNATFVRTKGNDVYLETSSGIKYFELSGNKYRMRVPLVPFNAYARYANEVCSEVIQEREAWDEVEFIVDKIGHGNYMGFEIKGDSMDDDSKRSFTQGDIVLARELDKVHWKDGLRYEKYPFWIIVLEGTILCKQIIDHNMETCDITCHSLNPSPEYSDFNINLSKVYRIFNIIQKISTAL